METMPHAVHTSRGMATDPVLSRRPVGDTNIPEPIIVPTINEIPLNNPTVLFNLTDTLASLLEGLELFLLLRMVLSSDSRYWSESYGWPLGTRWLSWKDFHNPCCSFVCILLNILWTFCWLNNGCFDSITINVTLQDSNRILTGLNFALLQRISILFNDCQPGALLSKEEPE